MKNLNFEQNPSYFSILPASVRYNPELSANAKLLFSEITALTNKEGYCWANNNYFANLFGVSKRAVTGWIGELIAQNLIKIEVDKENGNARKIYCIIGFESELPYLWKKTSIGMEKNFYQNNINNNIHNARAREEDLSFATALEKYGYCQQIAPAKDIWNALPDYEREQIMQHIPRYVQNHIDHGKRNYLPDFYKYLKEERYNAPALPYAEDGKGKDTEPDKTGWIKWPDGILRPPDVKKNPEGVYYHEGTNKPYLPELPKNPYR